MVLPEREMPGRRGEDLRRADADRRADAQPVERRAIGFPRHGATPDPLARKHDHAVDDEKGRRGARAREQVLNRLLKQQAGDAGGNRPRDQPPAEAFLRRALHPSRDDAPDDR